MSDFYASMCSKTYQPLPPFLLTWYLATEDYYNHILWVYFGNITWRILKIYLLLGMDW